MSNMQITNSAHTVLPILIQLSPNGFMSYSEAGLDFIERELAHWVTIRYYTKLLEKEWFLILNKFYESLLGESLLKPLLLDEDTFFLHLIKQYLKTYRAYLKTNRTSHAMHQC